MFGMGLSLVTVPLTLNYLGPERYGMWLTISSIIALLSFTDLGLGNGLLNALTKSTARGDFEDARRQVSNAFLLLTVVAVVLGGLFILLYPNIPWASIVAVRSPQAISEAGPAMATWFALFLLGLPLSVVAQVRLSRQEGYIVHLTAAAGSLISVFALLGVVLSHAGIPLLVVAMAAPQLVTAAINGFVLFRRDTPFLRPSLRLAHVGTGVALLRTGFLFFVLQIAGVVAFTSDTLVVAQLIGPGAVAEYGITSKLFMIPATIVAIAISPLWPAYGEAIARGDVRWARQTLIRSIKGALFVSVPAAVLLITFGQPIIQLWVGPSIAPPFLLLVAFGIWISLSAVGNSVAMLLNGAHEIRFQAAAAVLMAILNLGLSIWLTSRFGVAGVMWATVVAYSAIVLVPMALYLPDVLRRIESQRANE